MLGGDYSSKLAPWLAHGCVSPRHVCAEVRKFEKQRVENKSTYWLIFELIWRDFYKFFAVKHGNAIFFPDGTAGRGGAGHWKGGAGQWRLDPAALAAWKEGTTGYPLVWRCKLKTVSRFVDPERSGMHKWRTLHAA